MPTRGEAEGPAGQLPPNTLVVRGGLMARTGLIASARRYAAQNHGLYGLTFWAWPGLTAGQIAIRVKEMYPPGMNPLAHGQLRRSTVGKLLQPSEEGRAFELRKTGPDGHYTLIFPSEPTLRDWERLETMFEAPEANPAAD